MKTHLILTAAAAATLSMASSVALANSAAAKSATSPAFTGHQFAGSARVSLAEARNIALKAQPGAITDQELEKEHGGTGLRYSFDIRNAGVTREVGVDARTGKVLENSREGKNPD